MEAGPSPARSAADPTGPKLDALLRTAAAAVHADYAWIELEPYAPRILAAHGGAQPPPGALVMARRARASGGRLTIEDLRRDVATADARSSTELRAVLALPIQLDRRVVGAIGVAETHARSWSAHDTQLLGAVAAAVEALLAVEQLQRAMAWRTRVTRGLTAQNVAIRTLVDSSSIEEALARLLVDVAPILGVSVGAGWLREDAAAPVLRCHAFWSDLGEDTRDFEVATRSATLAPGMDLPGQVWADARAVWFDHLDSAGAAAVQRLAVARRAGLHVAVAFPIADAREVFGVIELYWATPLPRDQELLDGLEAFGGRIAEFIVRKRIDPRLIESEARFRILSETAADAIFTMDETSTILYVNPAVERVFGYAPEELVGRSMTVLIPERLRSAHRAAVRRHTRTGERHIPWSGVQLPGVHRDGHELPLEISFGEYMHNGTHVYTGIARDISEHVAHAAALQQQAEQLAQLASQLERTIQELKEQRDAALHAREEADRSNRAKSDFLAVMSHELRTPLNAIMGYTDLLDAGVPESIPPVPRQQVSRIGFSARHLLALIEEVLLYARLEAGRETPRIDSFSLRTLLDDVAGVIEPLAHARGLRYETSAPEDPGTLASDVHKIRQILINLLGNAVKFTQRGRVGLRLEREAGAAVFHIEDTGIGIAPEDLDTIFAVFWQAQRATTRSVGGTGLGLSVSRRLARLLGGDVTVRSMPGRGSTFTVRLPPLTGGS